MPSKTYWKFSKACLSLPPPSPLRSRIEYVLSLTLGRPRYYFILDPISHIRNTISSGVRNASFMQLHGITYIIPSWKFRPSFPLEVLLVASLQISVCLRFRNITTRGSRGLGQNGEMPIFIQFTRSCLCFDVN